MEFPTTTGIAVIDLVPGTGHMLEGFASVIQGRNLAMTYIPIFQSDEHQEWFEAHWLNDFGEAFQRGELTVPSMERCGAWGLETWFCQHVDVCFFT